MKQLMKRDAGVILTLVGLLLIFAFLFSGCTATRAWFRAGNTQAAVAEGCRAAMVDDNHANALVNLMVPYAEVKAAINQAHMMIQAALQKCVDDAEAAAAVPDAVPVRSQ